MPKVHTAPVTRKSARTVVAAKTAGTSAADATVPTAVAVTEQEVARRAYELYLEEGRPQGRHVEHWLRAEAELRPQN